MKANAPHSVSALRLSKRNPNRVHILFLCYSIVLQSSTEATDTLCHKTANEEFEFYEVSIH